MLVVVVVVVIQVEHLEVVEQAAAPQEFLRELLQ
jgi:hypothetical protein